jgi:uncharacterized membrane protein YkgB
MSTQALGTFPATERTIQVLQHAGTLILRYGLVRILLYFGSFKFTEAEARAIQPLLEHSPLPPGLWQQVEGFPAPSEAAAFILKDVFLLGAAIWTAAEALGAPATQRRR